MKRYFAALTLVPTAGRAITAVLIVVTLLAGLAPAVGVLASGWLVNELLAAVPAGFGSPAGQRAVFAAIALAVLFVLAQTATRLATGIATTIGSRVDAGLQRRAIRVDDHAAITTALTRAGGTDLVESGLTSQLGTAWGGTELSGGQWQKLALGRALMREAPLLRIFDEPTASLDAVTEQALFHRIAAVTRELPESARPTTILVSHRFATATMADRILVLDNGTIIECGDHKSLVKAGGRYAELYELQTQAYR